MSRPTRLDLLISASRAARRVLAAELKSLIECSTNAATGEVDELAQDAIAREQRVLDKLDKALAAYGVTKR